MNLKSKGQWIPLMIGGFLALSVVANTILVIKATSDPAFAVEPNYYQKAVQFDRIKAEREASLALGWRATLKLTAEFAEVRLVDRIGAPVIGAQVTAEAFPKVRAQRFVKGTFEDQSDGTYRWNYDFPRSGLWEFRLTATRDAARFIETLTEDVP